MKNYLLTIKGNDTFVYDCTLTQISSTEELLDKVKAVLNNLSRITIETLHIESLIVL